MQALVEQLIRYNVEEDLRQNNGLIDIETCTAVDSLCNLMGELNSIIEELNDRVRIVESDNIYITNKANEILVMLQDIRDKIKDVTVDEII